MTRRKDVWALIPVKALDRAKQRLSPVLPQVGRASLQRAMLLDMIDRLALAAHLSGVAVISTDPKVRELAYQSGARYLAEPTQLPICGMDSDGERRLNAAVTAGVERLRADGASVIAVLPADLPLLDPAELDQAITAARYRIVVVPDATRRGTNGILFPADSTPRFRFGQNSFSHHMADRQSDAGHVARIEMRLASFARDIDTPDDLHALFASAAGCTGADIPATRAALDNTLSADPFV